MEESYRVPKRLTGAIVAWSLVVCMAVAHTLEVMNGLLIWAMIGCSVALVLSGWLLLEHVTERAVRRVVAELRSDSETHLDDVANALADALEGGGTVTRLR